MTILQYKYNSPETDSKLRGVVTMCHALFHRLGVRSSFQPLIYK